MSKENIKKETNIQTEPIVSFTVLFEAVAESNSEDLKLSRDYHSEDQDLQDSIQAIREYAAIVEPSVSYSIR